MDETAREPAQGPDDLERRTDPYCRGFDAITRHRLGMFGLEVDALEGLAVRERMARLYDWFVERVPFENLSNDRVCREHPDDPQAWPRATDRFLREHRSWGLGGTSFTLAYALRDLLCGLGVNAHCTLGRNLVTEEAHAAVVAYLDDGPLLYDPALLTSGPLPVRPGGALEDPLGTISLAPHRGATLTVRLSMPGAPPARPFYSLVPLPAPPHRFRQAWVASFCRGRREPLRLARRIGDEIRRYHERPQRLEVLTANGRRTERLGPAPVEALHDLFGIDVECLRAWFAESEDGAP